MKIGFFVNAIAKEYPRYATTLLANEARKRGHEVGYLTVEDFSYRPDGEITVKLHLPPKKKYRDYREFFAALKERARLETIPLADLDVLMLRNDPAEDADERPWAQSVGIVFGQEAVRRGVLVLNDPLGLSKALNKLYFQVFPEKVRPKTLISRDPGEIRTFAREHKGKVVLKPLSGSGGDSVFLVREDELENLNQMIEAIQRHGYVVAQEYLAAAAEGDVRLFVMNGRPLEINGKHAAFRRRRSEEDLRSNMRRGGRPEKAEVTDAMLELAELVRPRLVQDGMFLVGLDIVGDKLLEVNVFSPGGLFSASKTQRVNFPGAVLEAIERKMECKRNYPGGFDNARLACF